MSSFEIYQNHHIKNKAREIVRKQQISKLLKENQHTLVQMNSTEFFELVVSAQQKKGLSKREAIDKTVKLCGSDKLGRHWLNNRDTTKNLSGFIPVGFDVYALGALAAEMKKGGNMFAKYQIKTFAGKPYIIFEGYAGLRQHLSGTRYLASNPKVVQMGVGKMGAANAIKSGFVIGIIVSITFHGLDQLLNDEKTWHHFVGGVVVDTVISALSTIAATAIVISVVGSAALLTIGPLIAIVVVGAGLAYLSNSFIDSNKLTDYVAKYLLKAERNFLYTLREMKQELHNAEKELKSSPMEFYYRLFGVPYVNLEAKSY